MTWVVRCLDHPKQTWRTLYTSPSRSSEADRDTAQQETREPKSVSRCLSGGSART